MAGDRKPIGPEVFHGNPPPGTLWRNKKTGGLYEVVGQALDSDDAAPGVIYQGEEMAAVWFRRLEEWADKFVAAPHAMESASGPWRHLPHERCRGCGAAGAVFFLNDDRIEDGPWPTRCEACGRQWDEDSNHVVPAEHAT